MAGESKDPLRYVPDFEDLVQDPSEFILGENPSHDEDSMAQYSRSQMSVGLRNELIANYSEKNVFKFLERLWSKRLGKLVVAQVCCQSAAAPDI